MLALAMGGACSDAAPITGPGGQPAPAPAAPAPPPAPAPVGSWVVQGAIVEDLPVFPDVRPGPHVPVRVFGGGRVVETTSGADGSFEVVVPENAPFVRVVAAGPQYFTPCPGVRWGADARVKEPLEVIVVWVQSCRRRERRDPTQEATRYGERSSNRRRPDASPYREQPSR